MYKFFCKALLIILLSTFAIGCVYEVKTPPPPPRVEVRPAPPFAGAVWIDGYWAHKNGQWVWIDGHWEKSPRPGADWVPGHWKETPRGWKWIPGHWR